jgi:alpha-1,6-mannosyltransferase
VPDTAHAACSHPADAATHCVPMRFCDLTHAYTPFSGGIRTYIDAKRRYLLEHTDHEHVLIIPGETDRITHEGRATTVEIAAPVIPGAAPYRAFLRRGKLRAALRETAPDVVELNRLYLEPWAAFDYRAESGATVSAFYLTDLPTAYVEPVADRLGGAMVGRKAKSWATRYVRKVLNRSDLAFAASPDTAAMLVQTGVTTPVYHIPLGVDLEVFHPSRRSDAVRARFGVGPEGLMLFYAGRLDSEKDVDTLVRSAEQLPEALGATLVLAGQGPHRAMLEARAEDNPKLHVLPYQSKTDLADLMASADLYLTAGPHETFALSVVEAQAAGLPVIGVAAGALVERVPEGVGFLGPVGDAEAMAAHIERAAADQAALSAASRRLVEEQFSWEATFERLLEAYADVGVAVPELRAAEPA